MSSIQTRNSTKALKNNASDPASSTTSTMINSDDSVSETIPTQAITLEVLMNQIKTLRSDIVAEVARQKHEIIGYLQKENASLKAELESVKSKLNEKSDDLVEVERDVVDLQQYIRRNNIEISGIPDSISIKNLEKTVIDIADIIGVRVDENDIEACHRLPRRKNDSGPKRTIVRFVNRKKCETLHRNKKKLERNTNEKLKGIGIQNKVYINANLCPYNKFLWENCKNLYENNMIDRFWVYNGSLHIAESEFDEGYKISHLKDLEEMFPDFDFY